MEVNEEFKELEKDIELRKDGIQRYADFMGYFCWCHGLNLGFPPDSSSRLRNTITLYPRGNKARY